ncbi:ribonuclease T2 family [Ceratobasidium sp. AG-Ba]|nr:ribonuclease T2 family [Ceratobasidium sp. AG-Ba]
MHAYRVSDVFTTDATGRLKKPVATQVELILRPKFTICRSLGWGGIGPNASDEDVASVWAQHWSQQGTCISTFRPACFDKNMPPGEENAWNDPGPALFVKAIHQQQEALLDAPAPLAGEPRQIRREVSLPGTPFLGTFQSSHKERAPTVQKLSFFAGRDRERAMHHEKDFVGFHHEEL